MPDPGELRPADQELLASVEKGLETVAGQMEAVHLRAALGEAMRLSGEVNKYLDTSAPWFEIKADKAAAAKSVYTAILAIDNLKTMLAPFIPFSCERLHTFLGYDAPLFGNQSVESVKDSLGEHTVLRYDPAGASGEWKVSTLQPGRVLRQPAPLFKKLEPEIVEQERARLGKKD